MTRNNAPVRLTSGRQTSTAVLLADVAQQRGRQVEVLTGSEVAERLAGCAVSWCGGPNAANRIAAGLGLGPLEPPDGWLARLPRG